MKISLNNVCLILGALFCYYVFDRIILFFVNPAMIFILQLSMVFVAWLAGSAILRIIYGVRRVQTKKDKARLFPLFNEVMKQARETHEAFDIHPTLYIDNSNEVNAYALGNDTVVVTRGAMMQLNDEQLKGILAHEIGHIYHGDTFLLLFLMLGNFIFLFFIGLFKLIQVFFDLVSYTIDEEGMKPKFISILFGSFATICMLFVQMFLMINSRTNEYGADHFALESGYGSNIIDSLYFLSNLQIGHKESMFDRLKASHPNIYDRIEVLENKIKMRGMTI